MIYPNCRWFRPLARWFATKMAYIKGVAIGTTLLRSMVGGGSSARSQRTTRKLVVSIKKQRMTNRRAAFHPIAANNDLKTSRRIGSQRGRQRHLGTISLPTLCELTEKGSAR